MTTGSSRPAGRTAPALTSLLLTLLVWLLPATGSARADDDTTPTSVTRSIDCMRARGWKVTTSSEQDGTVVVVSLLKDSLVGIGDIYVLIETEARVIAKAVTKFRERVEALGE